MQKKRILGIVIALLTVGFLAMLPGIAEEAYKQGLVEAYERELTASGLSVEQSLSSGTHHLRLEAAKRAGVISSALIVIGFHIPLFGIVILCLLYVFSVGSTKSFSLRLLQRFSSLCRLPCFLRFNTAKTRRPRFTVQSAYGRLLPFYSVSSLR